MKSYLYRKVQSFNELGGNLDNVTSDSRALQLDLIQEEYIETVEAFDKRNAVEFVDGVVDMWVVVTGLIQKLEALGVDMEDAIDQVCDNNLSKFMPYETGWQSQVPQGCDVEVKNGRLVIKDINTGKIKKPLNFVPVNLSNVPNFFVALEKTQ
jgi:hypothetical protein